MKILRFGLINYRPFCHFGEAEEIDPLATDLPLCWLDFSNDIIVIAGENNVGKTSLLSAYRDFRSSSFTPSEEDFFGRDCSRPIVMEILFQAEEADDLSEDQTARWFSAGESVARVRKVWRGTSSKAVKFSFEPETGTWIEGGFGGFDQILQSKLPDPIHIRPHMTADEIKAELQKLFKEIVQRHIADSEHVKSIEASLRALVQEIEDDDYIKGVARRVGEVATDIFPKLSVEMKNPVSDKGIGPLLDKQADVTLRIGDSPDLGMDRHGQGSQRVFILSALSVLADEIAALSQRGKSKQAASATGGKIIQIEEPELYLSPTAVRRMRKLLYTLSSQPGVQLMACTHSPVLIDFSRPQQTIALVQRDDRGGSRVFQSSSNNINKNQRDHLRLLYQINPVLSEALFANKIVLVEGETEFAAITHLLESLAISTEDLDVHIVDCRGKGSIPALQRVLREFQKRYFVIHDLDIAHSSATSGDKRWRENENIWDEIELANAGNVAAIGYVFNKDFETAHGYQKTKPATEGAINLVDGLIAQGTASNSALGEAVRCLEAWDSTFKGISDLKALT